MTAKEVLSLGYGNAPNEIVIRAILRNVALLSFFGLIAMSSFALVFFAGYTLTRIVITMTNKVAKLGLIS